MSDLEIRRVYAVSEEVVREGGRAVGRPLQRVAAIIPSAKKMGGPGDAIDVPLHYKDAAFVRSHFDAIEVRVPAAPRDDEIVVVAALACGGRPFARVGGLCREEAVGADGLR